jgi:hypothetical protein
MLHSATLDTDLTRRSLISERHNLSRFSCKCNFIYSHKKSLRFSAPIFTRLTIARQRLIKKSHAERGEDRTKDLATDTKLQTEGRVYRRRSFVTS